MTRENARIHLAGFLVSQSAKDCSIMVNITNGGANCRVIDFDLKLPELIESHYLNQDEAIIASYEWNLLDPSHRVTIAEKLSV
jgi:hypothetical protein